MKLINLDLNKISVFSQIIESGNYRLASEVLNVTPSALSQTVSTLEHSLGFALFHRVGKRLLPTEHGLLLHREFRSSQLSLNRAVQKMSEPSGTLSGTLRIGAYLEFAKSQLAPIISRFLKLHPETEVKLTFDTPTRLQGLLEKDYLDLCFSIFPSSRSRVINSTPVYQEELVLVSARGRLGETPSFDEVIQTPMVEYYLNHQPVRRWLELHYKRRPQNLPIRAYAATAEMVLALVAEGAGIGVVPKYILGHSATESTAGRSPSSSSVQIIRPTARKFVDHIWMLEPKMSAQRLLPAAFIKFATQQLSASRSANPSLP